MTDASTLGRATLTKRRALWATSLITVVGLAIAFPAQATDTVLFIVFGFVQVAPLVIPGILISAWVTASGAGGSVRRLFQGRLLTSILIASAIGAITPVCGVAVLPLMTGLLASGVPLAPVMAFWLSSPVTDPAMFATTAAMLGWQFSIGKSLAAFGLGLLGGLANVAVSARSWIVSPLRDSKLVSSLAGATSCGPSGFRADVWSDGARRRVFSREVLAMCGLIVICLVPAFAAEHLLNQLLDPQALTAYLGDDSWWAIPLAVFVGAPAYIDGYAALPLTRGLIEHGMSAGAAMAFLVSGSVVSIWGAMAILPVLRPKPFLLYLLLAVLGSLAAGWSYALVA